MDVTNVLLVHGPILAVKIGEYIYRAANLTHYRCTLLSNHIYFYNVGAICILRLVATQEISSYQSWLG